MNLTWTLSARQCSHYNSDKRPAGPSQVNKVHIQGLVNIILCELHKQNHNVRTSLEHFIMNVPNATIHLIAYQMHVCSVFCKWLRNTYNSWWEPSVHDKESRNRHTHTLVCWWSLPNETHYLFVNCNGFIYFGRFIHAQFLRRLFGWLGLVTNLDDRISVSPFTDIV